MHSRRLRAKYYVGLLEEVTHTMPPEATLGFAEPRQPFTEAERRALQLHVELGGSVLVLAASGKTAASKAPADYAISL